MDETKMTRLEDETELAYIYRIAHFKGTTPGLELWTDVARFLNSQLGYDYTESYYRKKVQEFDKMFEAVKKEFLNDDIAELLDKKREALYKQQVKTQDKMRHYRKYLRDEARIEVLTEAIKESANQIEPITLTPPLSIEPTEAGVEAILLISDWHTGAKFKNFKNSYDLAIQKCRIDKLYRDTVKYCQQNNVTRLHILNLGDMHEGNIHVSVRVESEIDVIQQVMQASEMIAELILALEPYFEETFYHHVYDNHSRINKNDAEHIEKENFAKLGHWWLQERLARMQSVTRLVPQTIDENIGYFETVNGKKVAYVHGHLDKINTVFQNLGGLLRVQLDYIFMGHYHVAKMKEFQGGKVFVNGSLKGLDPYALNNRYMGRASQFLLILDEDNEIPIVINVDSIK